MKRGFGVPEDMRIKCKAANTSVPEAGLRPANTWGTAFENCRYDRDTLKSCGDSFFKTEESMLDSYRHQWQRSRWTTRQSPTNIHSEQCSHFYSLDGFDMLEVIACSVNLFVEECHGRSGNTGEAVGAGKAAFRP